MILYYGKFGQTLKLRMPLKPIRSGYKVWCLNLQGEHLCDFEVYQGKGSKNEFSDKFGLGPSVVLGLLKSLPPGQLWVYIDNYFNTIDETFEAGRDRMYWDIESKYVTGLSPSI